MAGDRGIGRGVALALVLSACAPAGLDAPPADTTRATAEAPTPSPTATRSPAVDDAAAIQATLDDVAEAFAAADPDALRAHLHDPESDFGRRWLERADNLADVPLASYALRLDDDLPDLATDAVRAGYEAPTQVVYVVEEHALNGFDPAGPAAEDLYLTVVAGEDGWRVAADTDAERLGLVSADHLWDHGPVAVRRDGPLLVLYHPGSVAVDALLAEATAALAQARDRWPRAWPERVALIVPRDRDELAELLHVTFDLETFIAFATATPSGERGELTLTGPRIVVNPGPFFSRGSATRQGVLVHELLHVATRPASGPAVPTWLEEGVAQAMGEGTSTTGTRLLDAVVAGDFDGGLPTDSEFTTGSRDEIFLSYQLAYSFVEHLLDRYGEHDVARFYAEAGEESIGQPGTGPYHVDAAAREVFGRSLDDLRAEWTAAAR